MTDPISGNPDVVIALILPPLEPLAARILTQLGPASFQQWPEPTIAMGPHARQAGATGTTQQSQQDGLGLVVGMMRQSDPSISGAIGNLREEFPPTGAGCHLDRFAVLDGPRANIRPADRAGQPMPVGQLANESGILSSGRAQLVIQMRHVQWLQRGQFEQQIQQNARIQPARNTHEQPVSRLTPGRGQSPGDLPHEFGFEIRVQKHWNTDCLVTSDGMGPQG